jgi:dienelactone hydrolase
LTGTLAPMQFGTDVAAKGVRERDFEVVRGDRHIPGVLWTPADDSSRADSPGPDSSRADSPGPDSPGPDSPGPDSPGPDSPGPDSPRPVVMLGHGASGSKREDYIVAVARRLVRHRGLSAFAIDGPVHGDRRADHGKLEGLPFADFAQRWSADPDLIDDMVADWRASLDAVQALPDITSGACGYWGLSMGTIFGLPVVAAEPRVAVAVLGLMGIAGPTKDRFVADAAAVQCPLLFVVQWHDELFPREQAFALFEAFGSADKRMHVSPGLHAEVPAEEFEASGSLLASHLVI